MSKTLNKAMLIGNVGRDPELKQTPSGIPVVSFRLATHDSWKDRDGITRESTDWHTVVAWRGLANIIAKIVTKGSRVYIEGKIQTRNYEDKTGVKRNIVEILADNVLLLDKRKRDENADLHLDDEVIDDDFVSNNDNPIDVSDDVNNEANDNDNDKMEESKVKKDNKLNKNEDPFESSEYDSEIGDGYSNNNDSKDSFVPF